MSMYKTDEAIPIRPHHVMCLAFFKGEGYSEGFAGHMWEMMELFRKNARVRLVLHGDEICSACPNCHLGDCIYRWQVEKYDRGVMEICHLREGEEKDFLQLAAQVQKEIIETGKREKICGHCQWNDICRSESSKWKSTL